MRIFSYLFLLLIVLLGVTFAILNSESVSINYYVGHKTLALSFLLALVFAAGCFIGLIVAGWVLIKAKVKNHHLKKQLKLAEKEIENLRAIPLQDKD